MKKLLLIILVVLIGIPIQLDAKRKKKKKGSFLIDLYHNTTARYNGYFYAKLTMSESEALLLEGEQIDFDNFLELYPTVSSTKKQTISSQMQTVIEKSEKVILKHRKSKWVDNCNLLIGKAYLYLGEYEDAINNLLYVTSDFHNKDESSSKNKKKKKRRRRKKKKKRGSNAEEEKTLEELLVKYKISHQHSYYKSVQWLMLTFVEQQDFQKAMIVADLILNDDELSDRQKTEMYITQAHIYIKKGDIKNAILPLKKAIILSKKRKEKIKLNFLLGQIFLEMEQVTPALEYFNKVLDLRPDYEYEFNAKLKIASAFQEMSSGTNSNIKKLVFEMIEDEKNHDRLDQLYYTLGNISMIENDADAAVKYYHKSIASSIDNKHQKGLSYLKIGELQFFKGEYINAAENYDSSIMNMNKQYKDYQDVYRLQTQLDRIKNNIENIAFQDSIQELATLSEDVIMELINERIEARKEKIEREQQEQLARLNAQSQKSTDTRPNRRNRNAEWYFYNENTKEIGHQTFLRSWGSRKLEDNWRRKSKDDNLEQDDDDTKVVKKDESQLLDPAYYLNQIPNTDDKLSSSNLSIRNSLYELGISFKEDIKNRDKSIYYFKELIKRFPEDPNIDVVYFQLYLLNKAEDNNAEVKNIKNSLLTDYPKSKITKYLFEQVNQKSNKESNYENAYHAFNSQKYEVCISACNSGLSDDNKSEFKVKYLFLKAKSFGYLNRQDSMINYLQQIVKEFPDDPIKRQADDIIALLSNSDLFNNQTFLYRPTDRHFICVLISTADFQSSNLTVDLSGFNKRVFKRKSYQLINIEFEDQKMIIVKSFDGIKDSKAYIKALKKDNTTKKLLKKMKHELFTIGKNNYGVLMDTKNLVGYLEFYTEYYN